jgi:hypothetical protein
MPLPYVRSTSRTTKLGAFGETLLEHWLTRAGFHTALADAEGIDVLAVRPTTGERFGISMKARCYPKFRLAGVMRTSSLAKIVTSCAIWNVVPWVAVYAESSSDGLLVAMPLSRYSANYSRTSGKWQMLAIDPLALTKLKGDANVHYVEFQLAGRWL